MMRRGNRLCFLIVAVAVLGMLLLACTGVDGGGSTPVAPRTGMQAINAAEAAGATPDCSKYPQWMKCK